MKKALVSYLIFFVLNASLLFIIEPKLSNPAKANLDGTSQTLITTNKEFYNTKKKIVKNEKENLNAKEKGKELMILALNLAQ
ncbi:MAG: hypothetical protein HRT47_04895 [Candidatus Caenarcaniphilales bacterium]|nr:hypothetical protein [Candidatus Caenarcaniphilales bacterium]